MGLGFGVLRSSRLVAAFLSVLLLVGVLASPGASAESHTPSETDSPSASDPNPSPVLVDGSQIPGTGMDSAESGPVLSPVRPGRDQTVWPNRNSRVVDPAPALDLGKDLPTVEVPGVSRGEGRVDFSGLPVSVSSDPGRLQSASVRAVTGDLGRELSPFGLAFDLSVARGPGGGVRGAAVEPVVFEFSYADLGLVANSGLAERLKLSVAFDCDGAGSCQRWTDLDAMNDLTQGVIRATIPEELLKE